MVAREQPKVAAEPEAQSTTDIVVFMSRRDSRCAECDTDLGRGSLLRLEEDRALCLGCADLDHLEFLPRGNAALSRRARKHSTLSAVVVQWARARNRYERQGLLVEPDALQRAEEECLKDADIREHRRARDAVRRDVADDAFTHQFTAAVRAAFPGCPADDAQRIASHACQRSSGRVGRSAAARALDPQAVHLAVAAHIRHVHTTYDDLLSRLGDRKLARERIRDDVEAVLDRWRAEERRPR